MGEVIFDDQDEFEQFSERADSSSTVKKVERSELTKLLVHAKLAKDYKAAHKILAVFIIIVLFLSFFIFSRRERIKGVFNIGFSNSQDLAK